jgi:hypothetical protein
VLVQLEQTGVDINSITLPVPVASAPTEAENLEPQLYYTEGSIQLKKIRMEIAQYSLNRCVYEHQHQAVKNYCPSFYFFCRKIMQINIVFYYRARDRVKEACEEAEVIGTLYRGQYTSNEESRKANIKTLRTYTSNASNVRDKSNFVKFSRFLLCKFHPKKKIMLVVGQYLIFIFGNNLGW